MVALLSMNNDGFTTNYVKKRLNEIRAQISQEKNFFFTSEKSSELL
jgi:hypothetical protein